MTDDRPSPRAPPPPSIDETLEREREVVARALRRAGVSEAALDDAVQQVFLVASGKLEEVRSSRGRSFLLGIARNIAAHARRGVARRREAFDDDVARFVDDAPLADSALDAARLSAVVQKLLEALPPELRVVLILVDVEEQTMAKAAEMLDLPKGTVASRLRRARGELAAAISEVRSSRRIRAARRSS